MRGTHPGVQSAFRPDLDEDGTANYLLNSQTACLLTLLHCPQTPKQHAAYTDEQAEDDTADCLLHAQPLCLRTIMSLLARLGGNNILSRLLGLCLSVLGLLSVTLGPFPSLTLQHLIHHVLGCAQFGQHALHVRLSSAMRWGTFTPIRTPSALLLTITLGPFPASCAPAWHT